MKQLTILCSFDLNDTVRDALVAAGIDGFVEIPKAVGFKPGARADFGRTPHWEATVFIAPAEDDAARAAAERLARYAGSCEHEPCLRVLVTALEQLG